MIKLIKFFIKDMITDIQFIIKSFKRMIKGESLLSDDQKQNLKTEFKGLSITGYVKDNWPWILVIIFAFLCGWIVAARYYEIQCNNLIIETYINPMLEKGAYHVNNTLNFSVIK